MYAGFDYCTNYRTLTLYGEFSKQWNGGIAVLQGISFIPSTKMSFAMLYRNYPRNYFNNFNSAFAQNSNTTNERGLYIGLMTVVSKNVMLTVYADICRHE